MYNNKFNLFFENPESKINRPEKVEIIRKGKKKKKKKDKKKKPKSIQELQEILSKGGKEGLLFMVYKLLKAGKPVETKSKDVKSKYEYDRQGFLKIKERKKRPKKTSQFMSKAQVDRQRARELAARIQGVAAETKNLEKRQRLIDEIDKIMKESELTDAERKLIKEFQGGLGEIMDTKDLEVAQRELKSKLKQKKTAIKEKKQAKVIADAIKGVSKIPDDWKAKYPDPKDELKIQILLGQKYLDNQFKLWIMENTDIPEDKLQDFANSLRQLDKLAYNEVGQGEASLDALKGSILSSKSKKLNLIRRPLQDAIDSGDITPSIGVAAAAGDKPIGAPIKPNDERGFTELLNNLTGNRGKAKHLKYSFQIRINNALSGREPPIDALEIERYEKLREKGSDLNKAEQQELLSILRKNDPIRVQAHFEYNKKGGSYEAIEKRLKGEPTFTGVLNIGSPPATAAPVGSAGPSPLTNLILGGAQVATGSALVATGGPPVSAIRKRNLTINEVRGNNLLQRLQRIDRATKDEPDDSIIVMPDGKEYKKFELKDKLEALKDAVKEGDLELDGTKPLTLGKLEAWMEENWGDLEQIEQQQSQPGNIQEIQKKAKLQEEYDELVSRLDEGDTTLTQEDYERMDELEELGFKESE